MTRFDPYYPGQEVGPYLIIGCTHLADTVAETVYDAQWTCCETPVVVSHKNINKSVGRMTRTCRGCSQKRLPPRPVQATVVPEQQRVTTYGAPGAADMTGWPWMSLGAMGGRMDLAEHLAKRGGIAKQAGERA